MPSDTIRRYVVGLGNPGRQYAGTRHNVGFEVCRVLAERHGLTSGGSSLSGRVTDGWLEGPDARRAKVVLLEPHTYMNRSGQAVRQMMDFYKAGLDELLVVMDDMALPLGQLRFRLQGSAGGHNGLDDILRALGSRDVPRLRLGIGQPPGRMDPADYVLSRFRPNEQEIIEVACQKAADAVTDWMFLDPRVVMETYNRKPSEE